MQLLWILVSSFLLSTNTSVAQSQNIEEKGNFLCDSVLNEKPFDYKHNFSTKFVEQIPKEYFLKLVSDVVNAIGPCRTIEKVESNGNQAIYKFIAASSRYVAFSFSIDSKELIDSLQIRNVAFPDVVIDSWDAATRYANSWDGYSSISIENFSNASNIEKDGSSLQPLGSGFKLYVLGALADSIENGTYSWNQIYPITSEWKSLPSGVMQNLPEGKLVSLQEFAEYMIKISDNTATDHLINIMGRDVVESQLHLMGNSFENKNRPFLTTAEMFKIKWASPIDVINAFIKGTDEVRRTLLNDKIASTPLNQVGSNGLPMDQPSFIRDIEWFGSTNDLCTAMKSLKEKDSPVVLDILSKSVPYLELGPTSPWSYGGFKGGSEPGVLTMTYLVQSKNKEWGCISIAWHNERQNVNQWVFFDFAAKILRLAESYFNHHLSP